MLNPRKRKILQAIVDEYINTAEPVSSGSIVQKYGLDFSSATIRNEMADLEKSGYIEKTHTSSGRIPSALGYRLYVNELIKDDNISLEEIKYIQSKLSTKVNEIEDLTKITSQTLSEVTHYTSVAVGPRAEEQKIQEIKFVLLGTRMLMAVILTDTGMVKEYAKIYDVIALPSTDMDQWAKIELRRFNEYAKLAKNWNKLHDELEDLLIQYGLSQEDIGVYDYEEMEDYESE